MVPVLVHTRERTFPMTTTTISNTSPHVVGPILICIFLMLSYISCSAVLMSKIQSWTFLDAFYFCFMSIFTVGFGGLQLNQSNLAACVIYIFIGLILMSTCGHIFYEEVIVKLNLYSLARQAAKPRHLGSKENLADRKADNVLSWRESGLCLATIRPHRTQRDRQDGGQRRQEGDCSKPNEGCSKNQGIIKNTFKPILSSECRKKENVRLRFGQPIILAVPSNWINVFQYQLLGEFEIWCKSVFFNHIQFSC